MSSPNTGHAVEYSATSPSSSTAAAVAAAVAAGRKRQMPSAPSSSYSPNETLNQMTQEVNEFFYPLFFNFNFYYFNN